LHDEIHFTSIFVTNDQEEALEVADRVVVMNVGRIEQEGRPDEIYHQPANAFVYDFLGDLNLFHARVEGCRAYIGEPVNGSGAKLSGAPLAYVRPHLVHIERQASHQNQLRVWGKTHQLGGATRQGGLGHRARRSDSRRDLPRALSGAATKERRCRFHKPQGNESLLGLATISRSG
jgi:sulfate transport system ATP-binding protein